MAWGKPLLRSLAMPQTLHIYTGEGIRDGGGKEGGDLAPAESGPGRFVKGKKAILAHQKMCCYVLAVYQTFAGPPRGGRGGKKKKGGGVERGGRVLPPCPKALVKIKSAVFFQL